MTTQQYMQQFGFNRGASIDPSSMLANLERFFGVEGLGSIGQIPTISPDLAEATSVTPYSKEIQGNLETLINKYLPLTNVPKNVHGNLADTYATDVYGGKIQSDFLKGQTDILTGVGAKQSKSRSIIDELFRTGFGNIASLT